MSTSTSKDYITVPPDGGWGYVIVCAIAVMMTTTIVPVSSFALIFGNYFSSFTDETYITAIVTSLFMTILHISGLLTHFIFKKFSYRQVAITGACLYFIGSFASVFASDFHAVMFTYGILQGLGAGLIMPSALTSFNSYFDKKKVVMNSGAQAFLTGINILYPGFTKYLLDKYGFRGTQAIFAAISLHALMGALTLQPVKKHSKKVLKSEVGYVSDEISDDIPYRPVTKSDSVNLIYKDIDPSEGGIFSVQTSRLTKSLTSISTLGSMVFPIVPPKEKKHVSWLASVLEILDIALLKDIFYLNLAFGLALCTLAEMNFMAILPLYLLDLNFTKNDVTLIMTVYFASDLAMRILYLGFTAVFQVSNRKVFFGNVIFTIIIRLVFTSYSSFWAIIVTTAVLGCSRCLIQTPLPVTIAEAYSDKFSSALSFYMVITGIFSVALGAILGLIRTKTQNGAIIFHVLTVCLLLCVIPWTIEIVYKRIKKNKIKKNNVQRQPIIS